MMPQINASHIKRSSPRNNEFISFGFVIGCYRLNVLVKAKLFVICYFSGLIQFEYLTGL